MKSISLKSICYSSLFSFLVVFSLIQCSSDLNSEEEITSVTLTFSISGGGKLSLESGVYDLNSTINLVATPESGFYFDRWEGFESPIELEEYTFTATSDFAITAIFLPIPEVESEVEVYVPKKIDVNPIFMIKNGGTQAFLTDKIGNKLQTWNFSSKLGNELKLLSDGNLMGLFKPESVSFSFGGYGGILRKLTPTGETLWEYQVNTETELLHHDFEVLPNGNILLLIWELFNPQQASSLGYESVGPIYLEKIIELNPNTFDIEWEWRSVDHLIQDSSSSLSNFGSIEDHPEKIDLNYDLNDTGDLMHANGLFYDTVRDMIYLSVNFYSEVWVIPHSYNTEETKSELKEAISTIKSLKKTINEVNLLNAKLLFANKLFRSYNLTNEQKVKVVETLDRTNSVREVKLVFSTLAESLKFNGNSKKQKLSEGIASKAQPSTAPKKEIIEESTNEMANRFKKLANII